MRTKKSKPDLGDVFLAKAQKKARELVGENRSKWLILELTSRRAKNGGVYFKCKCNCEYGTIREVSSDTLLNGRSSSCGRCGTRRKPFCKRGHEVSLWGGRTPSGSCKGCVKQNALMREYGITLEEYAAMWEYQKGLCAICGKSLGILFEIAEPGFKKSGRAEVDHQHGVSLPKKQTVRGLLCGGRWAGCNRKLGRIDKIEWLKKVLQYLENPPARQILGAQ